MKQKLFALSLGFGGLIFATHHAFAAPSAYGPETGHCISIRLPAP